MSPLEGSSRCAEEPLITVGVCERLLHSRRMGMASLECSLDLGRSTTSVGIAPDVWHWQSKAYPYLARYKPHTIYHWTGEEFAPVARYANSLVKLIPTDWGAPTFEIDGIKMLPSQAVSPYLDAERKVDLIRPAGKHILDTCGGLGYFAAWCLHRRCASICSYEKNPDVIWLRTLNPWSPCIGHPSSLIQGDITLHIAQLRSNSFDAILHDPPRFGMAGELYSRVFYGELARVLRHRGALFHYTGSPNSANGRTLHREVAQRLRATGFDVKQNGDGLVALKNRM